jgi:hypothetical protein
MGGIPSPGDNRHRWHRRLMNHSDRPDDQAEELARPKPPSEPIRTGNRSQSSSNASNRPLKCEKAHPDNPGWALNSSKAGTPLLVSRPYRSR